MHGEKKQTKNKHSEFKKQTLHSGFVFRVK